jgi:hypothetical protein
LPSRQTILSLSPKETIYSGGSDQRPPILYDPIRSELWSETDLIWSSDESEADLKIRFEPVYIYLAQSNRMLCG